MAGLDNRNSSHQPEIAGLFLHRLGFFEQPKLPVEIFSV
jgi:hypothetical protein